MKAISRGLALEGNIRVLALQTFLTQFGIGMYQVVLQPYLLSIGVNMIELGTLQSITNLSAAIGLITWGFFSDALGRKRVILLSHFIRIVALVALLLSKSFIFLIPFAFFVGFSALITINGNPARNALISESAPTRRATAFSTLATISQITLTFTASLGGYLAMNNGYHIIFYICIIGDLLGILVMAFYLKETLNKQIDYSRQTLRIRKRLYEMLMPDRGIFTLSLYMLLNGLGYGIAYSLFRAMLFNNYGFTTVQLGLMSTIYSLVMSIVLIPLGRVSDRFGRKIMLITSSIFSIITVLGFLSSKSFETIIIFQITMALDISFFQVSWMPLISELVSTNSLSKVIGKLDSYYTTIGFIAPSIGGILYSSYGFSSPLTVHFILMIACLVLVLIIKEPKKQRS